LAGEIRWRSGPVQTSFQTSAAAAQAAASLGGLRADEPVRFVVQFDRPLAPAERDTLERAGIRLLTYVGDNAFIASGTAIDAARAAQVPALRVALPLQRAWKLHPTLLAGEVVPWSVVGFSQEALEQDFTPFVPAPGEDPLVAAYVLFHPDVDLGSTAVDVLVRHGATLRDPIFSLNGYVIELPFSEINALADEDAVQYIEPPLPLLGDTNSSNRARTGAEVAQASPYNLNGTGITVLVYDGGTVLPTHPDLVGRVRVADASGLSDHSTHVAGTIGGTGAASAGLHRGMAPGVTIESYGFQTGGSLEAGFLYTNPGDLEADYTDAILNHGADVSNNSIGTNTAANGFPCTWEGDYGATSALIDAIVRGSTGSPFRVVWANGNERGNGRCGNTYLTTAPPAGAKNHIAVGALNSNNDTITTFTSWGPMDDGRMKPDVSAPGCQSDGDLGVTSCSSGGGYNVKCGTSMASPTVCGLTALMLQDFRAQFPGDPDPRNSTLKALLAHTAVDLDNSGPDYKTGYGSVRVIPAIDTMRAGNFTEATVAQGETYQVLVLVDAGQAPLKVTLAWDDVPGAPSTIPNLVNDLDLRVKDANLNTFFPWTLNPASPASNAVRTGPNRLDNIEQVLIDTPLPGAYLVEVVGFNIPQGSQTFSIVATPQLINCSTQGRVILDRTRYPCSSQATIDVIDCDLDTNPAVAETININVKSTTESAGETLVLTETGPQTAQFRGVITLSTTDSSGVLLVAPGDLVTATYLDADDGFGSTNVTVTDTATVDCTAPVASGVNVTNLTPRAARVVFTTNELAQGTVHYGTTCGNFTAAAGGGGFFTNHAVDLTGLVDNTTYYYGLELVDQAGNASIDTNGGACYSFATPEIPDFFTEQFTANFDLENQALLFAPNGSIDFYGVCSYDTLALPTDPTGGNILTMSDTGSATVNITGGHSVLLYGTPYATMYVSANGELTFDAADTDETESYTDHFTRPRVACFWDDLDPTEGGTISYKQLADRIAVTWLNVPQDAVGDSNTCQIELYFDGRIQLSWLTVDANDGLVGLSAGGGTPPDFFSSDLSTFGDCGPRPPSAAGRTVILGMDRETDITLLASDDGLPAVPGNLVYFITRLPTHTLIDAGNDHVIQPNELPYTLVNGGHEVFYSSTNGFLGVDSFDFRANDGGSPPSGGDSNLGTVIVRVEPVLQLPFYDDFATTTFDPARWFEVTNATIDEGGIAEPTAPYSARLNGTPVGADWIITHLMDLSGAAGARVLYAFERTGTGETPDAGENLWVEFADTNGSWVPLQQYAGDGPDMTTYISENLLLPATALHDSFRLRFRSRGSTGSSNVDDWFVDDVIVTLADAPLASSQQVYVQADEIKTIGLAATDPNDDPLVFTIVTLPAGGTLRDPNGGVIAAQDLPYTLLAGGRDVIYQRQGSFVGSNTFNFRADDGVYQSNAASVLVIVEPVLTLPFEDAFTETAVDSSQWAVRSGVTIDAVASGEPSPPNSARFNGAPDRGDTLESFNIDLAGLTGIRLHYAWERTGGGDSPEVSEDLVVEYRAVGGTWVEYARYGGDGPDMTSFTTVDAALPANALHAGFRLRFRNSSASTSGDDWFVDDVRVYSLDAPSASNQSLGMPEHGMLDVTLAGNDPNLDPLTFKVTSLPSTGELVDPIAGVVISAGDLPHTLAGSGAVVTYVPPLGHTGSVSFNYRAFDGFYNSNRATVAVAVGGQVSMHRFPLDTDPGWSRQGLWQFGPPQGRGVGLVKDPAAAQTGVNVFGYNLTTGNGYYTSNMPRFYLTTGAMNCSALSNTVLRFQRWLGVESASFDHAGIEISTNGTTWSTVWEHTGNNINDSAWSLQSYSLAAVADHEPAVYLRWAMGISDDGVEYQGWNLDDIEVVGELTPHPGDLDGDGDTDRADLRGFGACSFGPELTPAPAPPLFASECLAAFDLDDDGDVDLADYAAFQEAGEP
jgi:hypothetical protein